MVEMMTGKFLEVICCIFETLLTEDIVRDIRGLGKMIHVESERSFLHSPLAQLVQFNCPNKWELRLRQLQQDLSHAKVSSSQDRHVDIQAQSDYLPSWFSEIPTQLPSLNKVHYNVRTNRTLSKPPDL